MKKEVFDGKRLARRDVLGAGIAGAASVALADACGDSAPAGDAGTHDAPHTDAPATPPEGSSCAKGGVTHAVSIAGAGIASQGTSTGVTDPRYMDPVCGDHQILVIHPTTKDVYVALQGACPHFCCNDPAGIGGPAYHASVSVGGKSLSDVVACSCHGSVFDALTGAVLQGPATVGLQVLSTCVSDGFVFVDIPTKS